MAWNISILAVKAYEKQIDEIVPDIFELSKENLYFEEVASVSMNKSLGVTFYSGWVIIVDVQNRFLVDDWYPKTLLYKGFNSKFFYVSEDLVYREYTKRFFKKVRRQISGIENGAKYLKSCKLTPTDEWGETIIFQILEKELFNNTKPYSYTLFDLKYCKYDLI